MRISLIRSQTSSKQLSRQYYNISLSGATMTFFMYVHALTAHQKFYQGFLGSGRDVQRLMKEGKNVELRVHLHSASVGFGSVRHQKGLWVVHNVQTPNMKFTF